MKITPFRPYVTEESDRLCLQNLRCPDSLVVKNRLKEAKDKLHRPSFGWVLKDQQYSLWKDGKDISLLWIKGGAGKGKTTLTIGLIEVHSREQDISSVMTYFCYQSADDELNTPERLIKGLFFRFVSQQMEPREPPRRRWDLRKPQSKPY